MNAADTTSSGSNALQTQHPVAYLAARELIMAGVPLFVAPPGTRGTEFDLPSRWEGTRPNLTVLDRWQPGWALAAVGGHGVDVIDTDPRNGGIASAAALRAAGLWPRSLGQVATCSGGTHDYVAHLGCAKGEVAPGVDLQAGLGDVSCGFAYLPPTVRISKATGLPTPYTWTVDLDLTEIEPDEINAALGNVLNLRRAANVAPGASSADDPFDTPIRRFTTSQAKAYCNASYDAFRAMRTPEDHGFNQALNDLACLVGHFAGEFITEVAATAWIYDAAVHNRSVEFQGERAVRATIKSGLRRGMAEPYKLTDVSIPSDQGDTVGTRSDRRVDLGPFLDGTYVAPVPSIGGERDAGCAQFLYPGLWHTVVGLTGCGKSWFALWHVVSELRKGSTVVYAHFEEASPAGMLARLIGMAPELTHDAIRERFIWLDCSTRWTPGEFAAALPETSTLVVLDGINAAVSQHGDDLSSPESVGKYRVQFVTPAARTGAAVLSLGHPVKDRQRQHERHSFGSTAWLDEVNGVGFRLESSKDQPIRSGSSGWANVFSVKDRYGSAERLGELQTSRSEGGWYLLGGFNVDSTGDTTLTRMSAPSQVIAGTVQPTSDDEDDNKVMNAINEMIAKGVVPNCRAVRNNAGIQGTRADRALDRLELNGRVKITHGARGAKIAQPTVSEDQEDEDFE